MEKQKFCFKTGNLECTFINDNYNSVIVNRLIQISRNNVIPFFALAGHSDFKTVKIYNVSEIGNFAFLNCNNLSKIIISNDVNAIGIGAFFNCIDLKSVELSITVTNIGDNAFANCSNLTNIIISVPNNDNIDFNNFCSSINFLRNSINPKIPFSINVDGIIFAVKNNDLETAFDLFKKICEINPSNTKIIPDLAFRNYSTLTQITIPSSVTSIGKGAFSGCSSLTQIKIPSSVTSIGKGAFKGCSSLAQITLPGHFLINNEEYWRNYWFFSNATINFEPSTQSLSASIQNATRKAEENNTANDPNEHSQNQKPKENTK